MRLKFHPNPLYDKLIKAGGIAGLLFAGKKLIDQMQKESTEAQATDNPAVGQAQSLRQAMNPSGFEWFRKADGTKKEAIWAIAGQIADLNAVRKAYENLYSNASLLEDLQSELDATDYQKFLALATKGKAGNPLYKKAETTPAKHWVFTQKETNARRTARLESKWKPGNNIIKTFEAKKLIGITTGKGAYDDENNVLFIEVVTVTSKKEKKYFFVAKSQVELLTKEEKEKREAREKLSFSLLEGTGNLGETPQEQLISLRSAVIYDHQFKAIANAPANIILGFPVQRLNTAQKEWMQFETVQGARRWVEAQAVRTIQR